MKNKSEQIRESNIPKSRITIIIISIVILLSIAILYYYYYKYNPKQNFDIIDSLSEVFEPKKIEEPTKDLTPVIEKKLPQDNNLTKNQNTIQCHALLKKIQLAISIKDKIYHNSPIRDDLVALGLQIDDPRQMEKINILEGLSATQLPSILAVKDGFREVQKSLIIEERLKSTNNFFSSFFNRLFYKLVFIKNTNTANEKLSPLELELLQIELALKKGEFKSEGFNLSGVNTQNPQFAQWYGEFQRLSLSIANINSLIIELTDSKMCGKEG